MSNVGPIQVFSQLGNQTKLSELVRFVSAFSQQMSTQFNNNLLGNRIISGTVGVSALVLAGNTSLFGASLVSSGLNYWVGFTEPYKAVPSVLLSPAHPTYMIYASGVTTTGFMVTVSGGTTFSFLVRG